MVSPPDRPIIFELVVQSGHPALLDGLDVWLRLGLLSDETVRQLCHDQLTCLLSEAPARSRDNTLVTNDFALEEALMPVGSRSEIARPPSPIARGIQSFMAEVSVVWLLFLGVFMVVVSSGVLAATQWRNFSTVGQYGILFAYTLAFWVASVWTGRQPSLRLTTRMLQVATLLIIPVNFWTMDGFRLWESTLGWVMAAIAAIVLTGITVQLLRPELGRREWGVGSRKMLPLGTAIALSWLHWGWGWSGFPLVATYVGTIGATIALVLQERELGVGFDVSAQPNGIGELEGGIREAGGAAEAEEAEAGGAAPFLPLRSSPLTLSTITIAIATLLLIARAVLAAGVPINRLGLAVGICGWLLCWLGRRNASRLIWQQGGVGLLVVGWLIAVTVIPPWQAIAISGLSLWLVADYLWRSGQVQYLTIGWLIGLQTVWLVWRTIPGGLQQTIVATSTQWAGLEAMPVALLGLWFFPYLALTVWFAFRLRRWQQQDLARQAEWLALGLGIALAFLSLGNGLTRSLNLALSTVTLSAVLRGRLRPETPLIYLTHGIGLAAIAAFIDLLAPPLSVTAWSGILLAEMVAEWSFCASLPVRLDSPTAIAPETRLDPDAEIASQTVDDPPLPVRAAKVPLRRLSALESWQQSTWRFGLVLAGMSYLLLRNTFLPEAIWGGIWLVTPVALTVLGSRRRLPQRHFASWLSLCAVFLVQFLVGGSAAAWLTSLGTATVLMVLNTQQLRQLIAAVMTVGFGLAFAAVALWEGFGTALTIALSVNLLAIALLLLWLLWGWLQRRETMLVKLYRQATDGWAIAIAVITLVLLTFCHLAVYIQLDTPHWQYVFAAGVLCVATSYRTWKRPQNAGFYAIAWSLELIATGIFSLTGRSLEAVAIANLALGLGTQLLGDWWLARRSGRRWAADDRVETQESRNVDDAEGSAQASSFKLSSASRLVSPRLYPSSWDAIPLLYALLGLLLQHRSFTATTGLYTLAAVLVGVGIGRRQPSRPLVYLSVFGASIAAYELLIYQLWQANGGETGDGIVLLAGLAAAIALVYRLLQRWLLPYLRLSVREVAAIAHLHWAVGSALMPLAFVSSLSNSGAWLWTGVAVVLAAYALAMGNERWSVREVGEARGAGGETATHPRAWTYTGIFAAIATIAHLFYQLLPAAVLLLWGGAIAAGVAVVLYQTPWQRWGWYRKPWQRSALILPVVVTLLTAEGIALQGLLIVAALYAWLAKADQRIRLSYLSVVLANWAILRWLNQLDATNLLWYAALISASGLYLVQVDPALRSLDDREKRHLLRSLATGLVCLTAFYQAEIGIAGTPSLLPGLLSGAIALGFVLAGLRLRIRAFLFVGTAVFMIQVLRQVARFASESLPLWSMGIVLGIAFIWIAATFEARRTQISTLMHYWSTELEAWE